MANVQTSDSELLNPVLSGLLGTDVGLSVLDWNSIASANIDLLGLLGEAGQDVTLSEPGQVANVDLTLLELINASAAVAQADGDTALVDALGALSLPVAELTETINLADLIEIGLPQGALAELELNALDLIGGAIQLYNYENVITTTQPIALNNAVLQQYGIGGAEILLQVVEPPHFECGGAGTKFHTSTVRAKLSVDLADVSSDTSLLEMALGPLLGGLVTADVVLADLDLYFEFGRADGEILSANPETKTASVILAPSAIDLFLGSIDDAIFFNRNRPIEQSDVDYATLGQVNLSLFGGFMQESAKIGVKSFAQSAPGTSETLFFQPPYPQRQAIGDGASSFSDLIGTLAQNLDVEVEDSLGNLIGPLIDTTIEPLIGDIVGGILVDAISPVLDLTVDPLLAFFGVGLGEAEASISGVTSICLDYSDCPISGPAPDGSSTANYGTPSHFIYDTLFMGSTGPDQDTGALANATATGDDVDGIDDEDGISVPPLSAGQTQIIEISVTEIGAQSGYLQGWIDWNGDGTFTSDERVATDVTLAGGGTISLSVTVPENAHFGQSFARFRWSTEPGLGPLGIAPDGEVEDITVMLTSSPAPIVSGQVFADTGAGDGSAHDAVLNGNEVGMGNVLVLIETLDGVLLVTTVSDSSGNWSATLPVGTTGNVVVRAEPPVSWLEISETNSGPPELEPSDNFDGQILLKIEATSIISDLLLGLIPNPQLYGDTITSVQAGQVVTLQHEYVAGSSATVGFTISDLEESSAGIASVALFFDNDCDGTPDVVVNEPVLVEHEERLCIVSRVSTSSGAANGANITYQLIATTELQDTSRQVISSNFDRIAIGRDGSGLIIEKTVENLSRMSGEVNSNIGGPGDVLLYRLKLKSLSTEPMTDVTVYDRTPPYTSLNGDITRTVQMDNGTECRLAWPEIVSPGYVGDLRWQCDGDVQPGAMTTLQFTVRIQN